MPIRQLYTRPFDRFPARGQHDERWAELGRAIAAERDRISDDPEACRPPETPGELTVIGSGIETVGFTSTDEILLREADHVFFCVADPATVVWLKALRPDAYDLYVLYDDTKVRYLTYMQMTEAMLHFVRKGRKVVGVYYGHPGIFVLSTHRAIRVARREGHRAVMRAAVSALDTLCADLGIDPSQPGMQTFEATDMLIRRRRPDPGLHLVLWQVGLIGEIGYRRSGYLNSGFSLLLDYLEEVYGPDHTVINYVGSRYPGIEPRREAHTITRLRDPDVQATVTGISTFYVAPTRATPVDTLMLEKLGLLKPGQTAKTPTSPLREIDRYGPREMRAFDDFARFSVPTGYHWQEDTAAARFLLALREDGDLRDLYARDPAAAIAAWGPAGLGPRERTLLAARTADSAQVAAKGLRAKTDPETARMLRALLTKKSAARDLLRTVRRAAPGGGQDALARWGAEHGYAVDWSTVPEGLALTIRDAVYPWNGFYLSPERRISIFLLGRPGERESARVYLNGRLLVGVKHERGTFKWRGREADSSSGQLHVDVSPRGARRLVGSIWPAGETAASQHRLTALEHVLPSVTPLAALAGAYRSTDAAGRSVSVAVRPDFSSPGGPRMSVELDGRAVTETIKVGPTGFELDGLKVPFADMVRESGVPAHLRGDYVVRAAGGNGTRLLRLHVASEGLTIDGHAPEAVERRGHVSAWRGGPGVLAEGEVTFLLDPVTLRPMLFGKGRSSGARSALSLVGMVPVGEADARALSAAPAYGLPDWAWAHLVAIAAEASRKGGLFLWQGWEKAGANLRAVRAALREVRR